MKKALLFFAVAAFSFTLPSCKKCSTCSYTWGTGASAQTVNNPEVCGKKKDVEAYEDACKASAALVSGTCNCEKS